MQLLIDRRIHNNILVRMEVFPERDGNNSFALIFMSAIICVRMEVFPERDGNVKAGFLFLSVFATLSEWRSSLKGMETPGSCPVFRRPHPCSVRMEVFPERDGNLLRG